MPERVAISVSVNGQRFERTVEPRLLLSDFLRHELELTGTHVGCEHGVCGACTILLDGEPVRSCQIELSEAAGSRYTTIEGLSSRDDHVCQLAWIEENVSQCGYCQPGMIMEASSLLERSPEPTDAEIDRALADHVCRCGTYPRVRRAIRRAASLGGGK